MLPKRGLKAVARITLALALGCTAGYAELAQSEPPTAQSIAMAIRAKRFKQALEFAALALRTSPNDVQVLTLEALAFKELGQNQNALAGFRRALQLSPDYLAALEGAAQLEFAAGSERAVPLLERLLTLRPAEPTAHAMRAVMAWKHRDCETAVLHFEQSLSVIETEPDTLKEFGTCLVTLKQPESAAEVFRHLVAKDPENRRARYLLVSAEIMAHQHKAALSTLQPLITGRDPDPEALALASAVHESIGDTPNAVRTLRQAIILQPRNESHYLSFADLSLAHRSYEAGIQMINAGLDLSPDAPKLRLARGILYLQIGQVDLADADFAASERLDPKQPGAAVSRVLKQLQQNDMQAALKSVHEEMADRPTDGFLYYLLAEVLNWQGPQPGSPEFQKALDAALTAVRLQPGLTLARNLLSRLYLDSGQIGLAIEQCRLVLRDTPHDPVALYRLMRALRKTGNPEDAKEVPDVLRRFNEARRMASEQEAQENRYKLVEENKLGR